MSEENSYEAQRLENIRANQALLSSLQLAAGGASAIGIVKRSAPPAEGTKKKPRTERKKKDSSVIEVATRRTSARLQGIEADSETLLKQAQLEEAEAAIRRKAAYKARHAPYTLDSLPEPIPKEDLSALTSTLSSATSSVHTRSLPSNPSALTSSNGESSASSEIAKLRSEFEGLSVLSTAKITSERVFSMVVHPEPTKTLVFVGDKFGQLGIWDALADGKTENARDEVDVAEDEENETDGQGKHWRLQLHGTNSLSCMKISPSDSTKLYTSSYDASIRVLDLRTQSSLELFSHQNEDRLITHFDLPLSGQEIWSTDRHGGLSHCDLREDHRSVKRRWDIGSGKKIGGVSVNPLQPHLVCTASNDQTVRIWDTRHLFRIQPDASSSPSPPPSPVRAPSPETKPLRTTSRSTRASRRASAVARSPSLSPPPAIVKLEPKVERETPAVEIRPTYPTVFNDHSTIVEYQENKPNGNGLMRGLWRHGKSCSSAYWDPSGRRLLTTSYDDHIRVWDIDPKSFTPDEPLTEKQFGKPTMSMKHDCQTGRWLSILRAQWSANTDIYPFFTVGNMRRSLDVVAFTGEPIARLFDPDFITAVPAVTASHPSVINHVIGGNGSGKCHLWGRA
ncbi:WD40 protein [Phaffia rhodozyma]|uniref:DNA damage-binding protein CMR1 n=1 Tax=Phaffia rhodozyma TaxID=264483 RepID=A0A0F7SIW6_PHARH|nr:WD40 protein [Phaffia rhodozyma]